MSFGTDCIKEYIEEVGNNAEKIIADGMGLQKKGTKYKCPNSTAPKNSWRDKKCKK